MNRQRKSNAFGQRRPVIAIDGPAGAGKSTIAKLLSERLKFALLDTGALYRGVALIAKEQAIDWGDEEKLAELADKLQFRFSAEAGRAPRLLINGQDRSEEIRTPEISLGASRVSKYPKVRARLLRLQRKLGDIGGVVVEGRDIGTVVFPDAELKIFLTADPEVRGRRRFDELKRRGTNADLAAVIREMQARDAQDQQRDTAPLKPANDAVIVDTSAMSIEEVVDRLIALAGVRAAFRLG